MKGRIVIDIHVRLALPVMEDVDAMTRAGREDLEKLATDVMQQEMQVFNTLAQDEMSVTVVSSDLTIEEIPTGGPNEQISFDFPGGV